MYNRTARISVTSRGVGVSGFESGRWGQRTGAQREEKKLLLQLLVCLALFLTVYVGKGIFPSKVLQIRNNVHSLISTDTDFRSVLSSLGSSLAGSESLLGDLGEFCLEVFGVEEISVQSELEIAPLSLRGIIAGEESFLTDHPSPAVLAQRTPDAAPQQAAQAEPPPVPEVTQPEPEVVAAPAAGTVLLTVDDGGMAPPERYTLNHVALGEMETVTPVMGHINSDYGYRDHPINGKYQFHGGLDIGGQNGDRISAFGAGTVEYVGEDSSYGLYLQIDHGNGVKSFYAHCKKITVSKGQAVSAGEKIAEVGSSGAATGPHLHLEIKYNGTHLNPLYYIDVLSQ